MAVFYGTMLFSVFIILLLGFMVKYRRAYWLISGYNTMSKGKQKNVDVVGLSKFVGNLCFLIALIFLAATIFFTLNKEVLGGLALFLTAPLSIYAVIKAQSYDGNTKNPDGTMKARSKWMVFVLSGILILVFVGAGVFMYYGAQPSQFIVTDEYLEIKGLYGERIPFKDISDLTLLGSLPKITFKNNGSSLGSVKKGNFKMEGVGNVKLFVDTSKPPFIAIDKNGQSIFLNCEGEEETKELFQ
ncbi:MAG: DUF3784 domain-containing protein, partial [Clostridia bacterium]|nr:DUF3784 domain-containing protein [Clostridia bacterium]